jgi:DNA-binding NarL/FixJ family response regulator
MSGALNVLLVDTHAIYRRGLAEFLRSLPEVTSVSEADSVTSARADPIAGVADLVFVGDELAQARELVRELGSSGAHVIAFIAECRDAAELVSAGAVGLLRRDTLTPEALAAAVQGAVSGTSVVSSELLVALVRDGAATSREVARDGDGPQPGDDARRLTAREQQVLRLVAEGHPTRTVAERLCYSERTVKNVLHDVVAKLGARSRAQAVAHAVRDGLI